MWWRHVRTRADVQCEGAGGTAVLYQSPFSLVFDDRGSRPRGKASLSDFPIHHTLTWSPQLLFDTHHVGLILILLELAPHCGAEEKA
jgi:hypothetical protein